MSNNFYSILTGVGKAKIANAYANRIPLELKEMALGDGGGTSYNPSENMTSLKNETYRRELNTLSQDPNNSNYLIAEMVIPADIGGFYVREAALFDIEGDMISIGKVPETYKPVLDEGAAKDLYVKFMIEVSNAETVTLKINPSVVLATKEMTENAARDAVKTHEGRVNPHDQYLEKLNYTAQDILAKLLTVDGAKSGLDADTLDGMELTGLQPAGDYANSTHEHGFDSISGLLPINKGGTGATTAEAAREALGVLPIPHSDKTRVGAWWIFCKSAYNTDYGKKAFLPAGGTWITWLLAFNAANVASGAPHHAYSGFETLNSHSAVRVLPGGSECGYADVNYISWFVFAQRIA